MPYKPFINFRHIFFIISILLMFLSGFMLLPAIVSYIYKSNDLFAFLLSGGITFTIATIGFFVFRHAPDTHLSTKDSFFIVTVIWIILGIFGAMPYMFHGAIPRFTDAFFESVSGFSTTGASILRDIEIVPKGLLFWRSLTHWIGGMGIIVLAVAVLPFLKVGGMQLFSAESSTVVTEKIQPKIIDAAKRLWGIYVALTLVEVVLLVIGKMDPFDAVCHSFGTVATGGFGTKNTSITNYSPYIHYVIMFFMFLSGINFRLHYYALKFNFRRIIVNEELKLYALIVFSAGTFLGVSLWLTMDKPFETAMRDAFFQVVSIITCTGFATADYLLWPTFAWVTIFILMFVGGCTGSTAGGIKVVRHLIFIKKVRTYFTGLLHPNRVQQISCNKSSIDEDTVHKIISFIGLYLLIFMIGSIGLTVMGIDIETSLGSVATCMGGIGPGLGTTGPAANFAHLPDMAKYLLSLMMLLGRLELYTFLVLFTPSFWRV